MNVGDRGLVGVDGLPFDCALDTCAAALAALLSASASGLRDVCFDLPGTPMCTSKVTTEHGRLCLRAQDGALRARAKDWQGDPPPSLSLPSGEVLASDEFAAWCNQFGLGALDGLDRTRQVRLTDQTACVPVRGSVGDVLAAALAAGFGLPDQAEMLMASCDRLRPTGVSSVWCASGIRDQRSLWAIAVPSAADLHLNSASFDVSVADAGGKVRAKLCGVRFDAPDTGPPLFDPMSMHNMTPDRFHRTLLAQLQRQTARMLGQTDAPTDIALAGLGIDSLIGAALLTDLEARIGVDLALERARPQTTLAELAELAVDTVLEAVWAQTERRSAFGTYVNPALDERLTLAGLSRDYVWGGGHILRDAEGREVIDCVAQYGALPFGHNPPEMWAALMQVQVAGQPSFMSLSPPPLAGRLGERLVALAPAAIDRAFFCTSGAEAIEGAIKLARSATGRQGILATTGGFHGLTLGALSVTGRAAYHKGFGAPMPEFSHIPFGDLAALERALEAQADTTAAFIVEPVQAEGGIITPPDGYLEAAASLCRRHGVLFVADEVQTGLGRLGHLFASQEAAPDIITLAKALGGGIVPMGAVLYRGALANDTFLLRHGSTFGSTTLGAAAGLATLDKLTVEGGAALKHVTRLGAALSQEMRAIAAEYPGVVREVRGHGLLQGMVFATGPSAYASPVLNLLCQWEAFGILLASYMLDRHGLRVAPALADGAVLRIEPPLNSPDSIVPLVAEGLRDLADTLARGDARRLLGPMLGEQASQPSPLPVRRHAQIAPARTARRFAFLIHLMGGDDLARFDRSLAGLDMRRIDKARGLLNRDLRPAVICETVVHAPDGTRAAGDVILVPHTAREMVEMPRAQAIAAVSDAIALGQRRGADIVGLGGFTSVVTDGGIALKANVPITTGNALTAVSAVDGILDGLRAHGRDPAKATVAIIGGFGSVGRRCVLLLAGSVSRVLIVGRPEPRAAAEARRAELCRVLLEAEAQHAETSALARLQDGDETAIAVFVDAADAIRHADAVIAATNALGAVADPAQFRRGAVVSDVSRPFNLPPDLGTLRPDLRLIEGGLIAPYGQFDLGVDLGAPPRTTYACMAETMLLALVGQPDRGRTGTATDLTELAWMAQAARQAGMRTVIDPQGPPPRDVTP